MPCLPPWQRKLGRFKLLLRASVGLKIGSHDTSLGKPRIFNTISKKKKKLLNLPKQMDGVPFAMNKQISNSLLLYHF